MKTSLENLYVDIGISRVKWVINIGYGNFSNRLKGVQTVRKPG